MYVVIYLIVFIGTLIENQSLSFYYCFMPRCLVIKYWSSCVQSDQDIHANGEVLPARIKTHLASVHWSKTWHSLSTKKKIICNKEETTCLNGHLDPCWNSLIRHWSMLFFTRYCAFFAPPIYAHISRNSKYRLSVKKKAFEVKKKALELTINMIKHSFQEGKGWEKVSDSSLNF